jgi:hypothetical protein
VSRIVRTIYNRLRRDDFPSYEAELRKAVAGCKSLLDVGCGSSSPIKSFSSGIFCVGIDAFQPSINKSREKRIHNRYLKMNALDIGKQFRAHSFDCVLASDLIEHLTRKEGLRLLSMIERIASKRVIVFTPNSYLSQTESDCNPWQIHKSGWTVPEMKARGYEVLGINGWRLSGRKLISMKTRLRRKIWRVISDITELLVKNKPYWAFQILCVREKRPLR